MNKRKTGTCKYCHKQIGAEFCNNEHERRYREKRADYTHKTYNAVRNNEPKRPPARFSRTLLAWLYSKPNPMAQN